MPWGATLICGRGDTPAARLVTSVMVAVPVLLGLLMRIPLGWLTDRYGGWWCSAASRSRSSRSLLDQVVAGDEMRDRYAEARLCLLDEPALDPV